MHAVTSRLFGFIASLLLTLLSYWMIVQPEFFHFNSKMVIGIIFILALLQALIQLIFFIDVWKEDGTLWNLSVFISTVSIIFIVVFFSIWIINHLNYNMQ